MTDEAEDQQLVKYEAASFELPFWPFGGRRLSVPTAVVAQGATAILGWIGEALGDKIGGVLGGLLGQHLGTILNDVEDLTLAISANGRVRVTYHVLEEVCAHESAVKWANYCPDCGDEMLWPKGKNPECAECDAPSHAAFNFCWACGEDFGEENATRKKAQGYELKYDCDNDGCDGKIAWLMSYCPWCGDGQDWSPDCFDDESECGSCDSTISADWECCAFCGEEQ